jgi:hypothetical protein
LSELIIYATTIVICCTCLVFGVVGSIAFWRTQKGAAKSFGLLFQRGNFLRIVTVIMVVVAIIFLTVSEKLSEGSVAVLSGVAGYVLGGLNKNNENETLDDENS